MSNVSVNSEQAVLDELRAAVEYPTAWKPEPGETLAGIAVRWETVTVERAGEEPKVCQVLVVRDADGVERTVWCWHTVLRNELIGNVTPGDFLAIHYRGKRTKQSGDGEYDGYRVAIKPGQAVEPDDDIPY